jgi:hypothetical protein
MPGEIFFLGQTLNRSVVPEGIKGLNPRRVSVFDCLRSMNDFSIEIRSRLWIHCLWGLVYLQGRGRVIWQRDIYWRCSTSTSKTRLTFTSRRSRPLNRQDPKKYHRPAGNSLQLSAVWTAGESCLEWQHDARHERIHVLHVAAMLLPEPISHHHAELVLNCGHPFS